MGCDKRLCFYHSEIDERASEPTFRGMNAPNTFSSFMFLHLIEHSLDHPQMSMTDSMQNTMAIMSGMLQGMMNGQTGTLVFQHCQDNLFILFHLSTCGNDGFNIHVYIHKSSCASSNDNAEPGPIELQTNVLESAIQGLWGHALYVIQMYYISVYTIKYHRRGVKALFTTFLKWLPLDPWARTIT